MVSMNRLTREKRIRVLGALVEGNSIRSTVRMAGVAKNTVVKLLRDAGQACEQYHNKIMVNLPCKRIQVDEIWSFCYAKQKNVPEQFQNQVGYGDVWTWVALDPDTKLVPVWLIGERNSHFARMLMYDLAGRLANRVQLTTDAYRPYYEAVYNAFRENVDYAQLIKAYFPDKTAEKRYSPSKMVCCLERPLIGRPDRQHISTSMVERQNLTMRMQMRRFTRLTNGFSKKVENLQYAVALHFMNYNFCRIHKSLRVTPAMAAGISDYLWKLEDIVELVENKERSN
jgi:IS1 family transposase